jgi:hypothetical protein
MARIFHLFELEQDLKRISQKRILVFCNQSRMAAFRNLAQRGLPGPGQSEKLYLMTIAFRASDFKPEARNET